MFDRIYIKQLSRSRMNGFMGNAILVILIALILGGMSGSRVSFNYRTTYDNLPDEIKTFIITMIPIIIGAGVLGILYSIFVGNVIATGLRGWFLRYWRGEYPSVGELFAAFRIYTPAMTTGLLRSVYVFLWTLLFIIPGIVMGFAYSMSDYVIYENPNISASRALDMSKIMTDGAKGDLFVYYLSFFGWALLAGITFNVVGVVYVYPYMYTSHAGVYESLKDSAIRSGRLTWEDFGQIPPAPVAPPMNPNFNGYGY